MLRTYATDLAIASVALILLMSAVFAIVQNY